MPTGRGTAKLIGLLIALAIALIMGPAIAAQTEGPTGASGLPLPRFVSLKTERVNVRSGPAKDNQVSWVYTRVGLPVEIIAEYDNWSRIRDWEGAEGWVYHSLLSARRTALVATKQKDELVPLYYKVDDQSGLAARLQAGVLASVKTCSGTWCHVFGPGFDGWIAQERLWGVYAHENID